MVVVFLKAAGVAVFQKRVTSKASPSAVIASGDPQAVMVDGNLPS